MAVWGDGVKTTLLVSLLLGAAVVIAITDRSAGVPVWRQLNDDLADAHERVAALSAETDALRAQIDALSNDPFALEQAIREDLVLARPGEVVVRFRPEDGELW